MDKVEKVLVLAVLALLANSLYAGDHRQKDNARAPLKTAVNSLTTSVMNANNLTSWITVDGGLSWPPIVQGSANGVFNGSFPKGVNAGFVYQEGIIFGGLVHDSASPLLRVGGSTYSSGMQSGSILVGPDGKVTGFNNITRIWRVRPDYKTADLTDDAAAFFQEPDSAVTQQQINELRSQYEKDWNEWPASKGAPFLDVNGDGKYEPDIDIPGVDSATQTIWTVANDLNSGMTYSLYGSSPIGIEEQITEWAWKWDGYPALDNIIYKQVKLIYKGTATTPSDAHIDSMYIAQWSDVDDGYYGDDFEGCDSTKSLEYVYNSENTDQVYTPLGLVPPAGGYEIVSGTSYWTGNAADSAVVNLQWRRGYKYRYGVPMTDVWQHWTGTPMSDPVLGGDYNGSLQMYNLLRGALPRPEYPAYVPYWESLPPPYNHPTNFILSGDPVTHSGLIDGIIGTASDRRFMLIHGPITMNLNDTVEIVIATIGAEGVNYISSVSILQLYAKWAQYAFTWSVSPSEITPVRVQPTVTKNWNLSQNYPNPFNPTTTIKYVVLQRSNVTLYVSNVLGEIVATLVHEWKDPGVYEAEFNGALLPSGVYLYRLEAGDLRATKKMLLLK